MIDSKLRKQVQPAIDQLAKLLNKTKLTPNQLTVLAFITGIIAGGVIGLGFYLVGIILLWLSGLLDVLDGTLARIQQKPSKIGAYMDLIFDRLVEAAVILGFYFSAPEHTVAYLIFFVGAMFNFTTFTVAGALFNNTGNKSMHYDIGIVERTKTFIFFTLMVIFKAQIFPILMAFNFIMILTGCMRFYRIVRYAERL
ncbi:MAG TPA: CDP-alcohol phosphatidyltransferase family protein [Clostridiales bacterium]|nr:CDP-alcohol phosphatidyltransferase family protein [Clostridiales bacterium]